MLRRLLPIGPILLASIAVFTAADAGADVRVAGIFGDHMVLQGGVKIPVWGWADPGETITVTVADRKAVATANATGRWRVDLDPLSPSDQPITLHIAGKTEVILNDVLVGEVWLAAGQSNMQYPVKNAHDAGDEIPKADLPRVRLCTIDMKSAIDPLDDRKASWEVCTPDSVKRFSAVGYFFGKDLHGALRRPVGLIGAYVAGTAAQSWTDLDALKSSPALAHYVQAHASSVGGKIDAGVPSSLFNGMIAPLIPFAIKGVVWYQGESNVDQSAEYRTLFPALITGWRKQWNAASPDAPGQATFPFLFVQLPGNGRREAPADGAKWAVMREAQAAALAVSQTAMAVTIDLTPPRALLHPKNKSTIGHRLALLALHDVYAQDIESTGPTYNSMKIEGNAIRIDFKHTAAGLKIALPPSEEKAHPSTAPPDRIVGFAIAGPDKTFFPADAAIDGASIVVHSEHVKSPVAVRYGWANNPEVNLYNQSDLPAAPFRTDDWAQPTSQPSQP